MTRKIFYPLLGIALLAVLAAPPPVLATNGMYLVSYGAETTGRAGANLAISDRTLGLNSNPAGICQLQGKHTSMNLSLLAPELESDVRKPGSHKLTATGKRFAEAVRDMEGLRKWLEENHPGMQKSH